MRSELGTTIATEQKEKLEITLAQYQLSEWGYPYRCSLSGKTLQRFDLPILSPDSSDLGIIKRSDAGADFKTLTLPGGGNDSNYSSWFQFALEIRDYVRLKLKRERLELDPLLLPTLEISWLEFFTFAEKLREKKDPPIEPIVDIARSAWPTLETLFRQPRKVLRRERELVGLDRLNEIDEGCIRWMVRQSGRNLAERAGAKQKLMGVVRKDDFDTLENRVVNQLALRIDQQSRRYLNNFKAFAATERYGAVSKFGAIVRQGHKISHVKKTSSLHGVPKPNFVLQFDPSYNKAWHWFIQLVRQEEMLDQASKWRSRLWRDMVFLTLNNVLFESENFETKPSFKMSLFQEHRNGQFILNDHSPLFWDRKTDYLAQVIPAHFPSNYQSIIGDEFGETFGATGASFALVFWKTGVRKPLHVKFIITEPRPRNCWDEISYPQDDEGYSNALLGERIDASVCVLSPSSDECAEPFIISDEPIDSIEIPSKNHDWQKAHFLKLGKLLAPKFL